MPNAMSRPLRSVFALLAATLLVACESTTATGPGPAPGPAPLPQNMPAEIRVAVMVPQGSGTERVATLGRALGNAARLAAEDAGEPSLRVAVYDTAGDDGRAVSEATRAVQEGADIIIGPLLSGSTSAVARVAGPAGLPVLSFSTDSAVAGAGVWVTGYLPEAEATRILRYASRNGIDSVGVFHPATPYGRAALDGAREARATGGAGIAVATAYPRSFKGIQDQAPGFAEQVKASGAQGVLLPAGGQELRSVGAFLEYHGVFPNRVQYLGLGQWYAPSALKEQSLRGGIFPAQDPDLLKAFRARYSQRFGETPPPLAMLAYDGVMIAASLWRDARATGRLPVFAAEALTRPQGFDGALGTVRLLPDGRSERATAILRVGGNGFEVVEPAERGFSGPGS